MPNSPLFWRLVAVAIALALARKVPALLLDEPTSGLDPQATAEFSRLITQLRGQGVAILMVTHDLLGAADVADRMGFIAGGRLVEEVAARGEERFDVRALHRHYAGTGSGASASASASADANANANANADADADAGVQGAAA